MDIRNLFRRRQKPKLEAPEVSSTEKLSIEDIRAAIELLSSQHLNEGDGNGAFLEPMTDAEYAKWVHEEEKGWRQIYDRLLRRD